MKRAYSTAALGLAIFLLLSSCNNEYGVLAEIQTEKENTSSSIFYRSSVQAFTRLAGNYYAVTNAIYGRPVASATGSDWAQVSVGSLGTDYRCRSIAATSTTLYAAIRDTSDAMKGIYSTTDGSTFTALSSNIDSMNVQALYAANDQLFAVVNTSATDSDPTFALYSFDGSKDFAPTAISGSAWIPGVAWDGTDYFVGQGSSIYFATNPASLSVSTRYAVSGVVSSITGSVTNTRAYVGTTFGYVYGTADHGSSWQSATPWGSGSDDGDVGVVKALVYLPDSDIVVAGRSMLNDHTSTFYGYYEIHLSGTTPGLTGSTSYIGSDSSALLKTNYTTTTQYLFVNGFYYDSTASRLFILENSSMKKLAALWSSHYDGAAWDGWVTE